jgi:aspartyl aminopeptidase
MNKRAKSLKKKLIRELKSAWIQYSVREKKKVFDFGDSYIDFLNRAKTERETVDWIVKNAKRHGFVNNAIHGKKKFFTINRNKSAALSIVGKRPITEGVHIVVSHIDSPRLDLKPNPLFEDTELALLKTHYYGGIKKYQWTSIPLSLHGVIIREDGQKVTINIGDNPKDPVFTIADLLPHLYRKEQSQKKLFEAIEGEKLTPLIGSIPFPDSDEKESTKLAIMEILNQKYSIKEEDFISAEIEVVPAIHARDVGLDRSMVGGYGQDDRICGFCSYSAISEIKNPLHSTLALFLDKEEIGSVGATGAQSQFLTDCIREIISRKVKNSNFDLLRNVLNRSKALSGDVNAAINPNYPNVLEKANAAKLGYGVVLTKYTGAGGKYGTNDASAEFLGEIRRLFKKKKVIWQTGELGKVDEGGGGTVSEFISQYGIETVDCGTALLGMHSPYEVCSKADLYETYRAYKSFLES